MNDRILNQDEIDAVLSGRGLGGDTSPQPAPSTEGFPQPSSLAPNSAPPSAAPARSPHVDPNSQVTINGINERVDEIGARMRGLESAVAESGASIKQMHREMMSLASHIELVGTRLEGVLTNLKSTLGYRAQKTFQCKSCGTKGEVAARVKCTRCNNENWWGWWSEH